MQIPYIILKVIITSKDFSDFLGLLSVLKSINPKRKNKSDPEIAIITAVV